MKALERYLHDCESKRRRSRDRPSNEVLSDLRRLLDHVEGALRHTVDDSAESVEIAASAFGESPPSP